MNDMKTINYFENLISESINHSYLKRYIHAPVIDNHQILALNELTKYEEDYEHLIHATMLVHIALNTHDKIKSNFQFEKNIKQQQLTVLAGDYFSGIYYYILAQHNNLPFIRLLADEINEVTQLKMTVFYHQYKVVTVFLEDYMQIHTGLISKIAHYTNREEDVSYLTYWLMLKFIEQEISYFYNDKRSFFQHLLINNVSIENDLIHLENILWQSHTYLRQELEKYQSNHLLIALSADLDLYHITKYQKSKTGNLEEGLSK